MAILTCLVSIAKQVHGAENNSDAQSVLPLAHEAKRRVSPRPLIRSIQVIGNSLVATSAIKTKIPFVIGDFFDAKKSSAIIRAVYRLGYFTNIQVATEPVKDGGINLLIIVVEKERISGVTFEGNHNYAAEKLRKKLDLTRVRTMDERELSNIAEQISKAYREKNFHHVKVIGKLLPAADGSKEAHFIVDEGLKTLVKKVRFKGNCTIPDQELRSRIFTREDWVFGMLDKSGTFHPDALLQDRYTIENLYQSNGFLAARVVDTQTDERCDGTMDITFVIEEGELYTVRCVEAPGNDLLTEDQILARIPVMPGQLYSKDLIRTTMEHMRTLWGEFGYIYADVQPSIRPDEKTKCVDITFHTDLGNCVKVNRIDIVGNQKTIDKVIRREILFDEGQTLTKSLMDESKRRIQLLGYFDPKDGVNWRIIKKDDDEADLELIVKEVNTGRMAVQAGFGIQPDSQSPTGGFSIGGSINDSNFRGTGMRYGLSGNYAVASKAVDAFVSNDWLFDRPVSGSVNVFLRDSTYEDYKQTIEEPMEHTTGGNVTTGFRIERLGYASAGLGIGYEDIRYKTKNIAQLIYPNAPILQNALQLQVDRSFQAGSVLSLIGSLGQDLRNHPMYPTDGYNWIIDAKAGLPRPSSNLAFFKIGVNANWLTPIIAEYGLVFHVHGFAGLISPVRNKLIPYRELYHIGGPMSVRGFNYGEIGPQCLKSSIGGTRAFFVNIELQIPITADGNMRSWIFYDGGSSWDAPDADRIPHELLQNNHFEYRHSVGFGFSVQSPQPIRVDWGFKLDRKKRRGESVSEVHFSSARSF